MTRLHDLANAAEAARNAQPAQPATPPRRRRVDRRALLVALLIPAAIIVAFGILALIGGDSSRHGMPVTIDRSAAVQAKRAALIAELRQTGVIYKLERPASLPHLWVTPTFLALDYDAKKAVVGLVYAYAATERPGFGDSYGDVLVLRHSLTGAELGTFGRNGLRLASP